MITVYTRKPVRALCAQYNGTVAQINHLTGWVKKAGQRQELYPEGEDGRLVLHGNEGTFDLFEGWWLVLDEGKFLVMDPDEFSSNYEKKE